MVKRVENYGKTLGKASFDRHVHYVDFEEHASSAQPLWFSVIRDPVEKYISRFNYMRKGKFKVIDL